jgi:hypothetical protein
VETSTTHQLTDLRGPDVYSPSISHDGSRIVFSSNHSIGQNANGDHNDEVFLATCGQSALRLQEGRFQVRARWRTAGGDSGAAAAVPMSDESGYFWFFDAANTEILVKVLDACSLPGFGTFWVFASGLTNVEVLLEVTDTVTNTVQTYENALGESFEPILDTAAFATCDATP